MPVTSIGDLSHNFQSARQTGLTKHRLLRASQELASGQVTDLTARLNGNVKQLAAIDREISTLEAFGETINVLSHKLSQLQNILGRVDDLRNDLATQAAKVSADTQDIEIDRVGGNAQLEFKTLVNLLNSRDGDRALLAGRTVDETAVASSDEMMADIRLAIGGAMEAEVISAAVDDWFNDPAGGFATVGYTGDGGAPLSRKISETEIINLEARADAAAFRDLLGAVAKAAVTQERAETMEKSQRAKLLRVSAEELFSAGSPLSHLRAQIGADEQAIETARANQSAQLASFSITRNDLVSADPFETATLLQDLQRQLEMQFASTARLSQLSLVNYL